MQHFRGEKKISLFIHLLHLMIMPLTSIEVERTELRRQIKEWLLGFVGNKEVKKNKRVEYIHSILSVLNLL